jgi:hypothetical protein
VATTKQKDAARKNIEKAREVQSARAHGAKIPKQSPGLSTADKDKLPANVFAFPKEHKEPLTDAKHVRNAVARFDQVEDVSDADRDAAWKRILKAAKKYDVDITESSWRELGESKPRAKASAKASPKATAKASPKASAKASPKATAKASSKAGPKSSEKASAKGKKAAKR